MSQKPDTNRKQPHKTPPHVAILNQLVVPTFEQQPPANRTGGPTFEFIEEDPESGEPPHLQGQLGEGQIFQIYVRPVDELRWELKLNLLIGNFVENPSIPALFVGTLLDTTPFHVRTDIPLTRHGHMRIGCDLIVRDDDEPLVRRRLLELLKLGEDLDWYFPLRMPSRLLWQDIAHFEMDWTDLPHGSLGEFVDSGLNAPPRERTPVTLLHIAHGLERWQDVLQLLREHPETFPTRVMAPLKCLAYRALRRWLPAIRAAKQGGIRNGRYPGAKWLSPSYLHALIEGGEDIEALRLLGKPTEGEPDFYEWIRGLALHRAGDKEKAAEAFLRYFSKWPGDIVGILATPVDDQ